jgi:DNA-binding transcriptional MerR regulator
MAKSAQAFRTISEAAEIVGAPQHVLRFWETKFDFISPVKRAGGRRFYRPQDIVVLKAVRRLLHDQGLTIKGVQKLYKEQGLTALAAYGDPETIFAPGAASDTDRAFDPADASGPNRSGQNGSGPSGSAVRRLRDALADIEAARTRLEAVLAS